MNSERSLNVRVVDYLRELGYSESVIATGVKVKFGEFADLVVYKKDNPWIVAEVKSEKGFPSLDDIEGLRFHPYIRQLQLYATSLNAPYYLLTNGEKFLWFTTDRSGRPSLLPKPITPIVPVTESTGASRESLVQILRELRDLIFRRGSLMRGNDAAVVIMAKLLSERGDFSLQNDLLALSDYKDSPAIRSLDVSLSDFVNADYFADTLSILNRVSFTDAKKEDLLSAMDEVFIGDQFYGSEPRVARWLADFLVRLGQLHEDSILLDVCSGYGDVLAAVFVPDKGISTLAIQGFSLSAEGRIWAQIQQLVLNQSKPSIFTGGLQNQILDNSIDVSRFTHVISAPSFGIKVREIQSFPHSFLMSQGLNYSEDLYLELAIDRLKQNGRVIMLVPDGMLFDVGKRIITRKMILERTRVNAIISLGAGLLMPYSSIKTSVLVLSKTDPTEEYSIFLAQIKDIPKKDTFNSLDIPQFASIINEYQRWSNIGKLDSASLSWELPVSKLDIENFTVNRYLPSDRTRLSINQLQYPKVSLKEVVVEIRRGTNIKLDRQGTIPVIGPGAVRKMKVSPLKIGSTTEDKIPLNPVIAQPGDIVINLINTYRGEAAVVEENLANSVVSSKVVLVRPDTSVVLPEYLSAVLNSGYVSPQIDEITTGSVIPGIPTSRIYDLVIPLPDIETQYKVVSRVMRAIKLLDQAQANLDNAQDTFQNIVQHLFAGWE